MSRSLRQEARRVLVGLFIPGIITIAAAATGAAFSLLSINRVAISSADVNDRVIPIIQASKDLRLDIVQVQQWLTDVSATRAQDGLDDGFDQAKEAVARFEVHSTSLLDGARALGRADLVASIEKTRRDFPAYLAQGEKMARAYVAEGPSAGNRMMPEFDRVAEAIAEGMDGVEAATAAVVRDQSAMVSDAQSWAKAAALASLAVVMATALAGMAITWRITGAIRAASELLSRAATVLREASRGDLNVRIVGVGRADEIGELLRNANRVLDLSEAFGKEAFAAVLSANRRDYWRRILTTGLRGDFVDYARIINSSMELMEKRDGETVSFASDHVRPAVDEAATAATQLDTTARMMNLLASDTNRQAMTVAAAADQASVNVQAVAAAVEEFTASIDEISQQVNRAAKVAADAAGSAARTEATVRSLNDAAQKIGAIVALINDIAAQTNLLALNATIEAARAGEAGKGFAVVAGEVKNLANQTARATEDITAQVAQIQGVAGDAIVAIEEIARTVHTIEEASQAVAGAVEEQRAVTREIARNVTEAATGATQVSVGIGAVRETSAHTVGNADEVQAAAASLSRLSGMLQEQIDQFLRRIAA